MNKRALNILFMDRTLLVMAAAILLVIIFTFVSFFYVGSIRDKNEQMNSQLELMLTLSNDVIRQNAIINLKEKKILRRRSAGIVPTLEQILKRLGIEARAIRPLGKKKVNEFTEDNAELEIMETDLNSVINLIYQIDTSSVPMKIKNASIKTTFEDPNKFILNLTVSLLSK